MEKEQQQTKTDGLETNQVTENISTSRLAYAFVFNGRAKEFFGIWIVSLFLSLITLGLYSAWAKVRTTQYFYGNMQLADSGFRYTADPVKILKGRVIALLVFAIYYFSGLAGSWIELGALLLLALLMPILVNMALAFRARVTIWRGVRFHFNKNFAQAAWIVGGPLLLSALFPLIVIIYGADSVGFDPEDETFSLDSTGVWLTFATILVFLLLAPWFDYLFVNFRTKHSQFGHAQFDFNARCQSFYWLHLRAMLMLVLLMFLAGVISGLFDDTYLSFEPDLPIVGTAILLLGYLGYWAYLQARRSNLIYRHTKLAEHRFESTLSARYMYYLYVSNTLGMTLSLGLLYPWAKVRTVRYRASKTWLIANSDLQDFTDQSSQEQAAYGEEMGEFFDLDLGI